MTKIKVGDTVWFEENWSGFIHSGTVINVYEKEGYADVNDDDFGTQPRLITDLYTTEESVIAAVQEEENRRITEIKADVNTLEDLLKFMYNNTISKGEYTDWTARRAVREIAKERFNIDLDT